MYFCFGEGAPDFSPGGSTISVIGLGKLGLCTAGCFASKGFKVIGVDVDIGKIQKVNSGVSPIEETNLPQFIKKQKGV